MQGWGLTELQYQGSPCFMILELYLEPSYFFTRIYNCNWSDLKSSQVPFLKVTGTGTKFLFKSNFEIVAFLVEALNIITQWFLVSE